MNRRSIIAVLCLLLIVSQQAARAGDYLNEQEVERVRDAQEIDKRTEVFLHIAERRLNVLLGLQTANQAAPKEKKDKQKQAKEDYGPEPTGTPSELLQNYWSVMSELLDKLDDAYQKKKDNPALAKAMAKLLDASQNHLQRLDQFRAKIRSESEETALEKAMEIVKMAIDGARGFKTQQ